MTGQRLAEQPVYNRAKTVQYRICSQNGNQQYAWTPKYRLHKRSGQAIVTLSGQDHYLGEYGSAENKSAYDRLISQWLANGRKPIDLSDPEPEITVIEICAAYWRHCKGHYVKDGKPTAEQDGIKAAMKRLKEEFRSLAASELGPLKIQALQQRFVRDGVSRYYVYKSIIVIGPKAQSLLAKYLLKDADGHCFMTERGKPYNRSNYRDRIRHACQMAFPAPKELSDAEKKVMDQIANNSPEQALLDDFAEALDDAVMDSNEVHQNQMTQYLNSPALQKRFQQIIFDMLLAKGA